MIRLSTRLLAASAAVALLSTPVLASAAADSTGWITSNGRYTLAGCSVYSEWSSNHKTAVSTETTTCPGKVIAGLKVSGVYYYGEWANVQNSFTHYNAGTAHYSGYKS